MASRDNPDLLAELRELVAKSIEANTRLIQNGTELVRRASSGQLAQLASESTDVLSQALQDYVRLSASHTSRLIDLGVSVSDRIVGRTGAATRGDVTSLFDLHLAGAPGAYCQTAFAVDNDHTDAVPVAFAYGLFVDEAGEEATDVAIRFEPTETVVPAGGQGRFVLSLAVPEDMHPGRHQTFVSIRGLERLGFRLLLNVQERDTAMPAKTAAASTSAAVPETRRAPAKKKATARKPSRKKTSAKKTSRKRPRPEQAASTGKKKTTRRKASRATKRTTR